MVFACYNPGEYAYKMQANSWCVYYIYLIENAWEGFGLEEYINKILLITLY